jgi:hypothetical protein
MRFLKEQLNLGRLNELGQVFLKATSVSVTVKSTADRHSTEHTINMVF